MHQEVSSTFQLGWHPEIPPSYAVNLNKILLKKGGEIQKEGGNLVNILLYS